MGSRRFFYFLPAPGRALRFDRAIVVLREAGLEFDTTVYINSTDADGVMISSKEDELEPPPERSLIKLLAQERHTVEVMCRDRFLAFTCTFGSPHSNPIFSINVSRKMWFGLAEEVRDRYELSIARVGSEADAVNILIVDDAPDDFLGRIEWVDRQWMVDTNPPAGTQLDPCTVWANSEDGTLPVMRRLSATHRNIGKYQEYEERLEA